MITVRFVFMTGIKQRLFRNAWLCGSWNGWIEMPMQEISANDGCPAFVAEATFADSEAGRTHHWGVRLDAPDAPHAWQSTRRYMTPTRSNATGKPLCQWPAKCARNGITSRIVAV